MCGLGIVVNLEGKRGGEALEEKGTEDFDRIAHGQRGARSVEIARKEAAGAHVDRSGPSDVNAQSRGRIFGAELRHSGQIEGAVYEQIELAADGKLDAEGLHQADS
mgnify:CR=1 FL=1